MKIEDIKSIYYYDETEFIFRAIEKDGDNYYKTICYNRKKNKFKVKVGDCYDNAESFDHAIEIMTKGSHYIKYILVTVEHKIKKQKDGSIVINSINNQNK